MQRNAGCISVWSKHKRGGCFKQISAKTAALIKGCVNWISMKCPAR